MKRFVQFAGLAVVAVFVFKGCIFSPDPKPPVPPREYLPQTSPENVVNNLATSYERREIEQYAKLLDPTFIFKFQTPDIPEDLPRDYWNRDEDSTGTGALFDALIVSSIALDLGAYSSEDAGRPDLPGGKRIRLTHVKLTVDQSNGLTYVVDGSIQDMYFRKGSVEAGTDSTFWYLVEWQDLAGGGGAPSRGLTPLASDPAGGQQNANWGQILADFARRR
jgi:hypothetical protein